MKKLLSLFLAAVMLLTLVPAVFAAETGVTALRVNPYGGEETDIDTVDWFVSGGSHFLFLPADVDLTAAKVYFTASGDVTLDGAPIASGDSAAAFTEGAHTLSCGGQTWPLSVYFSANIPAVFIETESGSLDHIHANKENKEKADIRIYENGVKTLDKALKQIKGRGNATWSYEKKPYNIKFDKKTEVLGMAKAKKWTLLASYIDSSLMRNPTGWYLAEAMGLPATSEFRHIDLYINGDYMGNYIICESVEVAENRVEITDLEKANENANPGVEIEALPRAGTGKNGAVEGATVKGSRKWTEIPNDPADITGGYLLEYEKDYRYGDEPSGFVTYNGQPIVIKSPEYASRAQVNYIADLLDKAGEALYSSTGYNSLGKHYTEYFDLPSLVSSYIIQELSMNYDAGHSSFFVYKAAGADSKLIVAPVWDLDNAFGRVDGKFDTSITDYTKWWANAIGAAGIPTILSAAWRQADFRDAVAEQWAQLRAGGVIESVNGSVAALEEALEASAVMNALRWNYYNTADAAACRTSWHSTVGVGVSFVAHRTAALDRGFGANGAWLCYDKNGADAREWAFFTPILEIGDTVTVRDITGAGTITEPKGTVFDGWNTEPDGSGTAYRPGDTLTLNANATVLYAVWKSDPVTWTGRNLWQRIVDFFNRIIDFFRGLFGVAG